MILWNFPKFRDLSFPLHDLEKAWQNGFVYVKPCGSGAVTYVMKYMRKEAVVPAGKNPLFYLSSRKPGIGGLWIEKNASFFREHPEQVQVSLTDPYTGMLCSFFLPRYFKDKISPTASRYLPRPLILEFKKFFYNCVIYFALQELLYGTDHAKMFTLQKHFDLYVSPVLKRFGLYFGWTDLPRTVTEIPNFLSQIEKYRDGRCKDHFTIDRISKSIPSLSSVLRVGLYTLPSKVIEQYRKDYDAGLSWLDSALESESYFGRPVDFRFLRSVFGPAAFCDSRVNDSFKSLEYFDGVFLRPLFRDIVVSFKLLQAYNDYPSIFTSYGRIRDWRKAAYERLFEDVIPVNVQYRIMNLEKSLAAAEVREYF